MKLLKAQARHEALKIKTFKSCSYEQCSPMWALLLVEQTFLVEETTSTFGRREKASMSLKTTRHTMGKPEAAKI